MLYNNWQPQKVYCRIWNILGQLSYHFLSLLKVFKIGILDLQGPFMFFGKSKLFFVVNNGYVTSIFKRIRVTKMSKDNMKIQSRNQ